MYRNMTKNYLGCPCGVDELVAWSESLNAEVMEQVSHTQELVMINHFAREVNGYQLKKSLQERISDIVSWRWVLEDLTKRLEEAIESLRYEHKALLVVINRIQNEIDDHLKDMRRGTLKPQTDSVEDAIKQEYNFLRDQKKKFEEMIPELEKVTDNLVKTKMGIMTDVLNKQEAISIDEGCTTFGSTLELKRDGAKKKKKCLPLVRWECRCSSLKLAGLRALSDAIITRQQVRGARVHLSIAAQGYAARVDAAIRRRHHANAVKLHELNWQKEEAIRDLKTLDQEVHTVEQSLIENMEQERVMEVRLAERNMRPHGELIKDDVDRNLRGELASLRHFIKNLRCDIDRIISLQHNLEAYIIQIDCYAEDVSKVVRIDEDRIRLRLGECMEPSDSSVPPPPSKSGSPEHSLRTIREEDEEDDD